MIEQKFRLQTHQRQKRNQNHVLNLLRQSLRQILHPGYGEAKYERAENRMNANQLGDPAGDKEQHENQRNQELANLTWRAANKIATHVLVKHSAQEKSKGKEE